MDMKLYMYTCIYMYMYVCNISIRFFIFFSPSLSNIAHVAYKLGNYGFCGMAVINFYVMWKERAMVPLLYHLLHTRVSCTSTDQRDDCLCTDVRKTLHLLPPTNYSGLILHAQTNVP